MGRSSTPPLERASGKSAGEENARSIATVREAEKRRYRSARHRTPPPDPDAELQVVVRQAGNDSADARQESGSLPRQVSGFAAARRDLPRPARIGNESSQLRKARSITPKKSSPSSRKTASRCIVAVTLLEKMPDEASQLRAIDYDTRLIDRVSKADPESRPQQMTLEDWQAGRNKFMVDLYVLRGRLQHHLHKNDDAVKDLTAGFRLLPNAEAALTLGEIAEEEKHADEAIRQYATAFILAGQEQPDSNGRAPGPRFAAPADGQSLAIHSRFERGPGRYPVIGL